MQTTIWHPTNWSDYTLIDSGNGAKLERFGSYTVSRPDPRALWQPQAPESVWANADATFVRKSNDDGEWVVHRDAPHPWSISYDSIKFSLRPTSFKHVGVFPEQAVNWDWMKARIAGNPLRILNLFAYTGGATMAVLSAGAHVTHVDAAKSTVTWARENCTISNLSDSPVRWIVDDASAFVAREIKRGSVYDGIILDPPRFGRGTKGQLWKIETDLPKLLASCIQILSDTAAFVLLNVYTADLSPIAIANTMQDCMGDMGGSLETGELTLKDSTSGRLLPNGISSRWSKSG